MKRTQPDTQRPTNVQSYQDADLRTTHAAGTEQTGGVPGGARGAVPTLKAEPDERAHASNPSFPPAPPPLAGMPLPSIHSLPYLHAGMPAPGQTGLAPWWPLPPLAPLGGMPMVMPGNAHQGMSPPAPASLMPTAAQGGNTARSASGIVASTLAPLSTATPDGATVDIFQDEALRHSVVSEAKDSAAWWRRYRKLQGEERARYGIASLSHFMEQGERPRGLQRGAMKRVCRDLGVERLMRQKWPKNLTLVHILVQMGLNDVLAEVLRTEAGRKCLSHRNDLGNTPLHWAARCGNLEAATLILNFDDEQGTLRLQGNAKGALPIHLALHYQSDDIVEPLLGRKSREQRLCASRDWALPLHTAIACGANAATIGKLLEDCAAEQTIFQACGGKPTPLHIAIRTGDIEAVKLLLAVKPALLQQLKLRCSSGKTVRDFAQESGDAEIIALLDEAMQELPSSSASSSTTGMASTSTTTSSAATSAQQARHDAPVPLTPYPQTPMPEPEDFDFNGDGVEF